MRALVKTPEARILLFFLCSCLGARFRLMWMTKGSLESLRGDDMTSPTRFILTALLSSCAFSACLQELPPLDEPLAGHSLGGDAIVTGGELSAGSAGALGGESAGEERAGEMNAGLMGAGTAGVSGGVSVGGVSAGGVSAGGGSGGGEPAGVEAGSCREAFSVVQQRQYHRPLLNNRKGFPARTRSN